MSLALAAHPMSVQDKVVYSWGLRGFVCLVFFWTKSRHCPCTPLKRQSNRLLETVFWMIEDYLPSASSEVVEDGFESGGLFAVGWSGNKNTISALHGWPFCHTLSELFWTSLTHSHHHPTQNAYSSPFGFSIEKNPNLSYHTMEQISKEPNSGTWKKMLCTFSEQQ